MNEEINLSSNGTQTSLNVPEKGEMIQQRRKKGGKEKGRERKTRDRVDE